jgi:hypothetical protein
MRYVRLAPLVLLLVLGSTGRLAAQDSLAWNDLLHGADSTWNRPTEDMQALSGKTVAYSSLSFFVDKSGVYEMSSDQTLFEDSWDGMIFLYAGSFDPEKPLENLIAANDNSGPHHSHLRVPLAQGVVYLLVTTTVEPLDGFLNFNNSVGGPGNVFETACFLDEPERRDIGDEMALDRRFCVEVTWKDFAGRTGRGIPVPHRSENSGMFWFFRPDNWELSVKVVDGCGFNGRYWVMISGSTNVQYEVRVRDLWGDSSVIHRTYSNPLGRRARTVLDTTAFDGCQ